MKLTDELTKKIRFFTMFVENIMLLEQGYAENVRTTFV